MLQVKSFKISDGEGISELLRKYRLAEGASMLISNGEIAVPYEDGEPMNSSQRAIQLNVEKNDMGEKIRLIAHSNEVLKKLIGGAEEQMATEKAKIVNAPKSNKEQYEINKEAEKEVKRLQNFIDSNNNTIIMNNAEMTRLLANVEIYDVQLKELENLEEAK